MNSSSCTQGISLCVLALLLCACTATKPIPQASSARFHERDKADLIVQFTSWQAINITRPDTSDGHFLPFYSRGETERKLAELQTPRNLAVVICNVVYSPEQESANLAEWNSILGGLGYHRAVYVRANSSQNLNGAQILKDNPLHTMVQAAN